MRFQMKSLVLTAVLSIAPAFTSAQVIGSADVDAARTDARWSMTYVVEQSGEAPPPGPVTSHSPWVTPEVLSPVNSPDVAVQPATNRTQSEISCAIHPTNANIMLVGANATDFPVTQVFGTGTYWSTDGGTTWSGSNNPGGVTNRGDPSAAIGPDGRFMMGFISNIGGMGVAYSTNQGATWTQRTVSGAAGLDKNHLMVDASAGSAFLGNYYNTWVNLGGGANVNDIEFSRSIDGGFTWTAPQNISNNVFAGSHNQGCNVQVGPNGEVYVAWSVYDGFPADEVAIGFNKSTNGGVSWIGETRKITGIRGHRNTVLPNTSIRRNSFPSMAVDVSNGANRGAIYIVWTNVGVPGVNTGTDASIWMAKSADGGATFSAATRVNNDAGANSQWFPWISCDPVSGRLAVVFYDRRDDPANSLARTYMATSNDGGATWDDFPVGDVSFTPAPIPGLAGGYMGDYLGVAVNSGKALPSWTDNRSGNFLCYVSPILLLDAGDPNPPTSVSAFSDFSTPASALLNWTDPTTFTDGTPLVDFSIDVLRDGVLVANVDQGTGSHVDGGLTDGQLYTYALRAHEDVTDSVSTLVDATVFAGGSSTPAAPTNLSATATTASATIGWTNPATQSDGTRLDDFAGVRVYRNGVLLIALGRAPADTGSVASYVDNPPPGAFYAYEISAIDSESPVHESALSAAPEVYVGATPDIIVWKAANISTASGDSLIAALAAAGETAVAVTDLFTFAPDLNVHEVVFACAGVFPNNHIISAAEGAALDDFVQDGGRLYLEGGDCFNFDPTVGGYNVRPIFGLNAGANGTADLFGVTGSNDLAGFQFSYAGPNNRIDDLVPAQSTAVLRNSATSDVVTVFRAGYFLGRAIGAAFEFGGLTSAAQSRADLVAAYLDFFRASDAPRLVLSADSLGASVLQTQNTQLSFSVSNPGTPNGSLTYSVAESPAAEWLSLSPASGSVAANGTAPITVTLNAGGLPPGLQSTKLVVTSNDPVTPSDTVIVTMDVLGIPALALSPEYLYVTVPIGGTSAESVTVFNAGYGSIDYTLDIIGVGGEDTDEFVDATNSVAAPAGFAGNVYSVATGVPLTSIEQFMSTTAPTQLQFFVYEKSLQSAMWKKISSKTVTSGVGLNWYSSGPITAVMRPSREYYVGCAWAGAVTAKRDDGTNAPDNVRFGTLTRSSQGFTYPPPDSTTVGSSSFIWTQIVHYGIPVDVDILSPLAGNLGEGEGDVIALRIRNGDVQGIYTALLNVFHNAPFALPTVVPITIGVGQSPTGVPIDGASPPREVALYAAAPNPFHGETAIRYDLAQTSHVRISVFDVSGRLVQTMRDAREPAGAHSVAWNGTNSAGERVAPGVYFYALEAGKDSRRRKVVLLR